GEYVQRRIDAVGTCSTSRDDPRSPAGTGQRVNDGPDKDGALHHGLAAGLIAFDMLLRSAVTLDSGIAQRFLSLDGLKQGDRSGRRSNPGAAKPGVDINNDRKR